MSIPDKARKVPSPLVETDWLAEQLDNPNLRILDCSVMHQDSDDGNRRKYFSGRAEWEKAHIPGSVFADILNDLTVKDPIPYMMPPPAEFAATMESLAIGDDNQVILYDNSSHAWAAWVWWMLRVIGFDSAAVLNGGWQKWKAEGRPFSTKVTSYPPSKLTVRHRPDLMATKQRVLSSLSDDGVTIINALSAEEYSGKVNRYPRAGRIAGSVNVCWEILVDPETHTFLPKEKLRAIFDSAGALSGDKVITYCGGGVAASADALALTLLGVQDVAVYDGGLIEWTADPGLPMEVD